MNEYNEVALRLTVSALYVDMVCPIWTHIQKQAILSRSFLNYKENILKQSERR